MSWAVRLSREAHKDLDGLPRDMLGRLERAIDDMRADPFQGDVKALKGKEWKGIYRGGAWDHIALFSTPILGREWLV